MVDQRWADVVQRLYNVLQHNVPTQYRFNVGPASQPIAGSMHVNRIRRWPNIETKLGDCPVFALTAIRVTLSPPKGHYPDNTIHWVNYEIMLGHRLLEHHGRGTMDMFWGTMDVSMVPHYWH